MVNLLLIKFVSSALVLIMLMIIVGGLCTNACAVEKGTRTFHAISAQDNGVHSQAGADHSPCSPCEDDDHSDGCDTCINCICHASMTVLPFALSYRPVISDLQTADPITALPEVYLSKFVPPQNLL
jgi:hypothetical protein